MTVIYILIAVIVGWFIGFLDSNMRTAKKIQAADTKAQVAIEEAKRKTAQIEKTPLAGSSFEDDPGLLRLRKKDGQYLLEIDGAPVAPVTGGLSQNTRKRLIELLTVFRLWLEPGQSSPAASQPAAPVQPATPVREAVSRPVQPVSMSLSPAKKPETERSIASLSIVQQIDSVLQVNMMNTSLAKRGIRLQESSQGGVEVYVGLQKFNAVDDVPDDLIKTTIRAAIAEWEKKYTPGM